MCVFYTRIMNGYYVDEYTASKLVANGTGESGFSKQLKSQLNAMLETHWFVYGRSSRNGIPTKGIKRKGKKDLLKINNGIRVCSLVQVLHQAHRMTLKGLGEQGLEIGYRENVTRDLSLRLPNVAVYLFCTTLKYARCSYHYKKCPLSPRAGQDWSERPRPCPRP